MIKLVVFIGSLTSGGAERVVSLLSSEFANEFQEVEIILYHSKAIWYEIDDRIKITNLETETDGRTLISKLKWLRVYVKKTKPDIVLSFLAPFNIFAIVSLLFLNIKLVVADRNDPQRVPNNLIIRKLRDLLYFLPTKIILQTESNLDYFPKKIRAKSEVIPNPVFIKEDVFLMKRKPEKRIATAGRLVYQKNQKLLIESFTRVLQYDSEYILEIYGEGPMFNELSSYIDLRGLTDKVFLRGATKDIHSKIYNAKCFVLTSYYEGMPNALIEAMALGIPCISTKVSGARDLISDGVNGYLVNDCVDELSQQIINLISDDTLCEEIGNRGSSLRDDLNYPNISEKWINMLRNC